MAKETTDERMQDREELLAALEAADTAASEEPRESEELASDSQEAEKPETTPEPEAEEKAESTEEAEAKADGEVSEEAEDKPLSNREKKSNERLIKGWDKLNAEKAALKREREALEQAQQEHSDDQTSPQDYRDLADRYREDGETELADLAEEKARGVEKRQAERKAKEVAATIESGWNENLADLQEQYPDLKDGDSEMARGVEHILNQRPALRGYAEGIQDAVEFVQSKLAAKEVESLTKKNGDLQAEIDELKKQTSVSGSPPERESSPSTFDDMSQDKRREKLLAAMASADEQGMNMTALR